MSLFPSDKLRFKKSKSTYNLPVHSKGIYAQVDNVSVDSIKTLLCHKWGFRAIIMGGKEMTNFNETVTYEFSNDFTLQRVTEKKTEK